MKMRFKTNLLLNLLSESYSKSDSNSKVVLFFSANVSSPEHSELDVILLFVSKSVDFFVFFIPKSFK